MKHLVILLTIALSSITHSEDKVVYVMLDNKAYKAVEYSGKYLTSNEYTPLLESSYTDEYFKSEKYKQARHANNLLFKIRTGRIQSELNEGVHSE